MRGKKEMYISDRKNGMTVAQVAEKYGVTKAAIYSSCRHNEMVTSSICPPELMDEKNIRKDCIMFRQLGDGSRFCSGLRGLYCGIEPCKFFKPRKDEKR